jgi:hypothetical protein
MQSTYRVQATITKGGKLSIKGLPFIPGESVVVTVRRKQKKTASKGKYPLRGKPFTYHEPFKSVDANEWDALK